MDDRLLDPRCLPFFVPCPNHVYSSSLFLSILDFHFSLAEVYETEYLATQSKESKENPAHAEIQKKMDALFLQLDALANFHFTPKPAAADVTVR